MVIKGNGAVNTMEAVKINTKENGILTSRHLHALKC